MRHYGDITKIDGMTVPIVDIVCGGSPCQDLSVAGRREGLAGERSGLFMEQIRIVKELRRQDEFSRGTAVVRGHIRPRFMVWENVKGALSSNGGEDFRVVLEEIAKVADEDAVIPRPDGKWTNAGCIVGNGWSIAWRIHNAKFWGVPQRRERISVVADFGGQCAPEILFERKSLSGDSEEGGEERKDVAADTERSIDKAISFQERAGKPGGGKGILIQNEAVGTLSTLNNQSVCYGMSPFASNAMLSRNPESGIYEADTARTLDLNGGNPACNQGGMMVVSKVYGFDQGATRDAGDLFLEECSKTLANGTCPGYHNSVLITRKEKREAGELKVFDNRRRDAKYNELTDACSKVLTHWGTGGDNVPFVVDNKTFFDAYQHWGYRESEVCGVLTTGYQSIRGDTPLVACNTVVDRYAVCIGNGQLHDAMTPSVEVSKTLNCLDDPMKIITYQNTVGAFGQTDLGGYSEQFSTLRAQGGDYGGGSENLVAGSVVRRLTPKECERLQGFPDDWTNIGDWTDSKGKTHKGDSDAPRFKALGNSIALPFWQWLARRIVAQYVGPVTMASLFDGIGGFPLVFERCGCKAVWASEIEEFPIAVTKKHFPEE